MAAMHARLFFETIVPLLVMVVTCLIGISTPLNENNYFSKLLDLFDDNGEPFFDVIHIGLVCDECLKLELQSDQLQCTHLNDNLPPWKSAARNERFKKMYIETGNASMGLRENAGASASDVKSIFDKKMLEGILINPAAPHFLNLGMLNLRVPLLWITCDPDADGPSEMSIVSGFVNTSNLSSLPHGAHVITGLELKNCRTPAEQNALLRNHIIKLRQIHMFADSRIIFIPENMTAMTHTQLADAVGDMVNVITMHQNGGVKAGINKNDYITRNYVLSTNAILQEKMLFLSDKWISESAPIVYKHNKNPKEAVLKRFTDQICRYGYDERMKLTGKFDKDEQDDAAIGFFMFCYWPQTVMTSTTVPHYREITRVS